MKTLTWLKKQFNPRTIRGWWVYTWAAPFVVSYAGLTGWMTTVKPLMAFNFFTAGLILMQWVDMRTIRRSFETNDQYIGICDKYNEACERYQAELGKAATAFSISQAMLHAAQTELAKNGIFMNVKVQIVEDKPKEQD